MARTRREVSESGIYKINLRGNDGVIFKKEQDYTEFTALLEKYFECGVIAYSLNAESADLIVKTDKDSIGVAMKPFLTSYARYYNRVYDRTGKVFYDRYKSEPVDADGLEEAKKSLPKSKKSVKNDIELSEIKPQKAEKEPVEEVKEEVRREEKKMDFWLL